MPSDPLFFGPLDNDDPLFSVANPQYSNSPFDFDPVIPINPHDYSSYHNSPALYNYYENGCQPQPQAQAQSLDEPIPWSQWTLDLGPPTPVDQHQPLSSDILSPFGSMALESPRSQHTLSPQQQHAMIRNHGQIRQYSPSIPKVEPPNDGLYSIHHQRHHQHQYHQVDLRNVTNSPWYAPSPPAYNNAPIAPRPIPVPNSGNTFAYSPPSLPSSTPYLQSQQQFTPSPRQAPATAPGLASSAPVQSSLFSQYSPPPSSPLVARAKASVESERRSARDQSPASGPTRSKRKRTSSTPNPPTVVTPLPHAPAVRGKSTLRPPKQSLSTWQIFFTDWIQRHSDDVSAGQGLGQKKLNVAQAAKQAGKEYARLSVAEKEPYRLRAAQARSERTEALSSFYSSLTPSDIAAENAFRTNQRRLGLSRRSNLRDPNAPKKPLSAYFMFLRAIRDGGEEKEREVWGDEKETTRQSVLAAEKWRMMSDEEKKPFLARAEHEKLEYEAARQIYEEKQARADSSSRSPPSNNAQLPRDSKLHGTSHFSSTDFSQVSESKSAQPDPSSMQMTMTTFSAEDPSRVTVMPFWVRGSSTHNARSSPAVISGEDSEEDEQSKRNTRRGRRRRVST
ncbi:hypothetical protein SISNIDRAFT_549330 [Sistotremastrum niveocremeum HHB9708]|uniref:HMG box domain-containing protein n=2 Tax=Sistotremastraceae TaxID=3402574 RepID=A0A164VFR5_9AGAM|nr:hypothetical protein SISNIDRAFT_549330 [Sistotremastrum niveocremeum HHB9708]KZT35575.1 hypothetical protein SISSUDRAFT_1131013 [Sistotremastrum suecicum HHB10207 ss-3]